MPLSKAQDAVAVDTHRFRVVVAGRRFGKTHLSIRELCYHAKDPGNLQDGQTDCMEKT